MSPLISSVIGVTAYGIPDGNGKFPSLTLIVDGTQIGQVTVTNTSATYTFNNVVGATPPQIIQIGFYNTNGTRALELTSISVNGQTYAATSSNETYSARGIVVQGSGDLQYGGMATFTIPPQASSTGSNATPMPDPVPTTGVVAPMPTPTPTPTPTPVPAPVSAPATVTIGSGPDTLSFAVSEDAYLGDAQFTISVDGVQQGGVQTTTAIDSAGQTQTFKVLGSLGTTRHTVSVNFLNDAYGGSATTDRNLYVKSVTLNGTAIAGSTLSEPSSGPQSFSFGTMPAPVSMAPPPSVPAPTPTPTASAINISASGNDTTGDGSIAHPFATLQRAIGVAEQSSTKLINLAAGTYHVGNTVALTTADNGINVTGTDAILDGSAAGIIMDLNQTKNFSLTGVTLENASTAAIAIDGGTQDTISGANFTGNVVNVLLENGASSNTVKGNTMLATGASAIEVKDGSNGNTFSDNIINGVGASETSGGAFYLHGANNNLITHNLIENTQGAGIDLADFYTTGTGTENIGNTISYNDIENTDLSSTDSGAIYILGRSQADTMTVVTMNFINGAGRTNEHSVGIYLDDNADGVTATNNIVTGSMSDAFQIHGGNNDHFVNNIFDLGSGSASAGLFQPAPADQYSATQFQNDSTTRNVYISESSLPRSPLFANFASGTPAISGNDYWDTVGARLNPTPDVSPAYINPNTSPGSYLTSGDGIGFVAIDQSMIGLLKS